jgi:cytoskeletal protein CcmA (bactofilin family)
MAINIPVLEEINEDKITTVIADDLEIRGTLRFKTSVMLKGIFEGEIYSDGLLVVGPTAKVTAAIATKTFVSHGVITGNVTANEQIVLKSTSTHTGDLKTSFLTIENGAIFNGKAIMERSGETESQDKEVVAVPQENILETTMIQAPPEPLISEEKQEPFGAARHDQKKKYSKDKISATESEKNEDGINSAEQADTEDKILF